MKTVCKKLLCLMLVAMLLVSAVPAAFATGDHTVTLVVKHGLGEDKKATADISDLVDAEGYLELTDELLDMADGVDLDNYAHENNWWVSAGSIEGRKVKVESDLTVAIRLYEICECGEELIKSANHACSQEEPEEPEAEKYTVRVTLLKSDDTGSAGSGSKTVEEGTYVDFEDLAAEFCTLSKYSVQSVLKNGSFLYSDGMEVNGNVELVIYVKPETSSTPNTPNNPSIPNIPSNPGNNNDTENKPDQTVGTCKLTINYHLEGYTVRTQTVEKFATYDQYVGIPARNGYTFRGWFSERYDDFIDIEKDVIKGDDIIEAIWSSPTKYTLTLDQNRKDIETVNRGVQVTMGEFIYDKVMNYKPADRKGYVFMGWKLNGKMITEKTVYDYPGDATAYAVWALESDVDGLPSWNQGSGNKGKVYLEIYTNGDTGDLVKRINITDYADDNKITRAEAEKVAKKNLTAKNGYSLKFEGLFDEDSWWWYCRDKETDGEESIIVNREGDEYIYIMVKNVKKAVADSSNPKTGDNIMIAVTTMTLAAVALVSMVELKKRKMI